MNDPVRAKIIELVPEIVELKHGFRFEEKPAFGSSLRNDTHQGEKIFTVLMPTTDGKKWIVMIDGGFQHVPTDQIEGWHIPIGRPITLADVLRAVEETKGPHDEMMVATNGEMEYYAVNLLSGPAPENEVFTETWSLTSDYDGQTQEVKDFIGKLLNI